MRRPGVLLLALLLAVLGVFGSTADALAQGTWVAGGPYGGTTKVLATAAEPDGGLYAGVVGYGVYRRAEGDPGWTRLGVAGLNDLQIAALVQSQVEPMVLYVGTYTGIYRSFDGGQGWAECNGGHWVSDLRALAVHPTQSGVVYAAAWWDGYPRVYKTVNGGDTWNPVGPGIPDGAVKHCVAVDPRNPLVLYVGTDQGVYKSADGGALWVPMNLGLLNRNIETLTIDKTDTATIYAGANGNSSAPYAGVYVTHDGGGMWAWISTGLPNDLVLHSIAVSRGDGAPGLQPVLYVAAEHYDTLAPPERWEAWLYKSTDGGASWRLLSRNIAFPELYTVATDPGKPDLVYVGCLAGGVFRSEDGAEAWRYWSEGMGRLCVTALAVDPGDENRVFAGAQVARWYDHYGDAGVWASLDRGETWTPSGLGLYFRESTVPSALAVAPVGPMPTLYLTDLGQGAFRSVDAGRRWEWLGDHGIWNEYQFSVAVDPLNPRIAYTCAAGYAPNYPAVFKTVDGGETWSYTISGLPLVPAWLAINPALPDEIYLAGGPAGVYKSLNGGETWQRMSDGLLPGFIRPLAIDSETPETVFAGERFPGDYSAYATHDGANRWRLWNEGIQGLPVEALAVDASPGLESLVFAGTLGKGVFSRAASGRDWQPITEGLPSLDVYSLAVGPANPEGRLIYAGTSSGVAWRCTR